MTLEKQSQLDKDVHEYLTNGAPRIDKGAALACATCSFLNGAQYDQVENFLLQITQREHRTLQQLYFNLVLSSIRQFANLEDYQVDDRNRASVRKAKAIYDFMLKEGISTQSPLV